MSDSIQFNEFSCKNSLYTLRDKLHQIINEELGISVPDLSKLHTDLPFSSVNNIRLSLFKGINQLNWRELLFKGAFTQCHHALGPDLMIQTKLNVSIQLPGDSSSILPLHSDCNSGDSPFQLNLWIPLTDAYGTNSMFLHSPEASIEYYRYIKETGLYMDLPLNSDSFVNLAFGNFLLFNPAILHGNVVNTTEHTRISLNVRVRSILSPDLPHAPEDRKYGSYYTIWSISDNYSFSHNVFKILSK